MFSSIIEGSFFVSVARSLNVVGFGLEVVLAFPDCFYSIVVVVSPLFLFILVCLLCCCVLFVFAFTYDCCLLLL